MKTKLFVDLQGKEYSSEDLLQVLQKLGADKAKILYLHTDIGFGKPLVKRKVLSEKFLEVLQILQVPTLIFPAFTFSFCNRQSFDRQNSPTKMGMLNEFARKQKNAFRTLDPLLSVCVLGEVPEEYKKLSHNSCGIGGHYDLMGKSDDYMFLFLGAKPTECFTFKHYAEAVEKVPYRYDKVFEGEIIDEGRSYRAEYILPTLYDSIILGGTGDIDMQNNLEQKGILKKISFAGKDLFLIKGQSALEEMQKMLQNNVNCFLARPWDAEKLGTNYVYENVVSVK